MSNGTTSDFSGSVASLTETLGKLAQQQVELLKLGIGSAVSVIGFVGRTSINIAGGVLGTVSSVMQTVLSIFAPKK
ncbi:MAG: chlorosome envelope protein B [Chlorobiaceae bacterium]